MTQPDLEKFWEIIESYLKRELLRYFKSGEEPFIQYHRFITLTSKTPKSYQGNILL